MKKIFFCTALILGSYFMVDAQSSTAQGSKNTTQGTSKKSKRIKIKKATAMPDTSVYNRKEFRSKKTKQTATPTGQEATGTNGSHSNNPKNAARKEAE